MISRVRKENSGIRKAPKAKFLCSSFIHLVYYQKRFLSASSHLGNFHITTPKERIAVASIARGNPDSRISVLLLLLLTLVRGFFSHTEPDNFHNFSLSKTILGFTHPTVYDAFSHQQIRERKGNFSLKEFRKIINRLSFCSTFFKHVRVIFTATAAHC